MRAHAGAETWERRVAEWRASGLTSEAYCEGKPFTPGGLRHWAYRLGAGRSREAAPAPPVRIAKVVRIPRAKAPPEADERACVVPELILEVGPVRIEVRTGFDRATLAAVLDVVAAEKCAR